MTRRRGRTDGNHTTIVTTLRLHGWRVLSLADLGHGVPDALCYHPGRQEWRLVEIKDGDTKKLTPDQVRFHQQGWRVSLVRSVKEAIEL